MKMIALLALCVSSLSCLTIVSSPFTAKAQSSPEAVALTPLIDSITNIVNQEREILSQPPSLSKEEQLQSLYRSLLAEAFEAHSHAGMENFSVPSWQTTQYFGELYQRHPTSGLLASLYADSIADQHNNDGHNDGQAEQIYQSAFQANPNHPLLYTYYAAYLERQGTWRGIAVLEEAIRAQPQDPTAYFRLAAFQQDDIDAALAVFDRAIAAFPNDIDVYLSLSKFALDADSAYDYWLDQVIERLTAGQARVAQPLILSLSIAALYDQSGRSQQAIEVLEQGLAQEPLRDSNYAVISHHLLAKISIEEDQMDRALSHYAQILERGGDLCYEDFSDRVQELQAKGKGPEIFQLVQRSLQQTQSPESTASCTVIVYLMALQDSSLRQAAIDLLALIPSTENADSTSAMFNLMLQDQQYSEIVRTGTARLAQGEVLNTGALIAIGNAARELNQFEQAREFYLAAEASAKERHSVSTSTALNFTHPELLSDVRWYLGAMHLEQGEIAQAIEQFELATEAWPIYVPWVDIADPAISFVAMAYNSLGEIYQSQGDLAAAQRYFEAAIADSEEYAIAHENLAKLQ